MTKTQNYLLHWTPTYDINRVLICTDENGTRAIELRGLDVWYAGDQTGEMKRQMTHATAARADAWMDQTAAQLRSAGIYVMDMTQSFGYLFPTEDN